MNTYVAICLILSYLNRIGPELEGILIKTAHIAGTEGENMRLPTHHKDNRTGKYKFLYSALISTAVLAATNPAMAYAEEKTEIDEETVLEEVIVTGIRASIMNSVAKKRNNSSIVEALSAEDIGKLPDASIAESIARLPGLAAQRLDGRANVISIRGLSPDFTTALLNGREQVTSNNNRGVEFDQYPSELMSGVTIYKTPDAGLMGQAIGGTIDLHTIRPLTHGEQSIAVGLRGEYNDLGALNAGTTATGYRGSFSYIDQFADDTVGVAFGYARMVSPSQEERWQAWGYPNLDYNSDNPLVLGGAKPFVKSNKLTRDGLMGVFEYEPDDRFHMLIDVYYSKFNDVQRLRGIEIPGQWGGGWANSGITAISDANGLVTEGVINDAAVVVRNDVTDRDVTTWSAGWNAEYQISDQWSVEGDLAYSKVDRTLRAMESYAGTGRGNGVGATDQIGFKMTDDGSAIFSPGLDYSDPGVIRLGGPFSWGDPLGPSSQDGFINKPVVKDELSAIRLSAERQFEDSAISSVEIGARYSQRDKSLKDNGFYLTLKGYLDDATHMLTVPSEYLLEPTSLAFFGMGDMLSYDSLAFYEDGNYIETDVSNVDQGRAINTWKVKEKVFNAYIQANIDTEVNGNHLTGNVGLQVVHTDQSSDGRAAININGEIDVSNVTGGDKYWTFLPSANLSYEVSEDTYLRIAGARVMARAPMDKMNASRGFNYNAANASVTDPTRSAWSGWGGNPELRPWMATQFDLSFETYFGDGGYIAMAFFYKKLENIHFDEGTILDFTGATVPAGAPAPATNLGSVWSPTNGEGGGMHGFELSASLPGDLISDSLDGFGALFSASLTKASVRPTKDAPEIDMPGLSETVINATLYYEKHGFQSRISARYRSDFLGEVSGLSLVNDMVFIKAETIFDAQIGYDFSDHGVEGLSVLFQVNNLTNERFSTYQNGDTRQVRDFQNYGRTFMFGLNYRM